MLLLFEILRVVKQNFTHIMICSRYDYSVVTLILCKDFSECSLGYSSLGFPGGDTVVSLTSLSRKRDNALSAFKNTDSTSVIRYIFKLKNMDQRKGEREKPKRKILTIVLR